MIDEKLYKISIQSIMQNITLDGAAIIFDDSGMAFVEIHPADAVEVVHGRWIHPKGYVVSNGFLCSECGHEEYSLFPINPRSGGVCIADENGNFYHPPKMNYCPNCGAKMDGDVDG